MVIAHAVSAGTASDWQVVVCVANFGAVTATQVTADVLWQKDFRVLALRSKSGQIDLNKNRAHASFGNMAPGRQVQVTLLLAARNKDTAPPAVQTQLTYRDGPPRDERTPVHCEPDGLQAVRVSGGAVERVQHGPSQRPVIAAASPQPAGEVQPAPPALPVPALLVDQPLGQLTATSWLCFGAPLMLLLLVVAVLTYRLRARAASGM
jgi:hypothetical protein